MSAAVPRYFQSIRGLGPVVRVFESRTSRQARLLLLAAALICGAGALALAAYALVSGYRQYYAHGPALVWQVVRVPALAALALAAGSIAAGWRAYTARCCAVVYSRGFAYQGASGTCAFRWEDITGYTAIHRISGLKSPDGRHTLRLTGPRGERVSLSPGVAGASELVEAVRACAFPVIYERLARQYDQGQTLSFGPVTISRAQGMNVKGRALPWQSLESAALENGVLVMRVNNKKEPGPIRVPANRLPNLDVLLTILDLTVGVRANPKPPLA